MRPKWMDTFKFTVILALLAIPTFFLGWFKFASFLVFSAFVLFLVTAVLWLMWLLNIGRKK